MFTGLIEAIGDVIELKATSAGHRLRLASALAEELAAGDSLAVNGVCLTVILASAGEIHADVSPETIRVTTLGAVTRGTRLNLERPVQAGGRMGGHFVQGHVDGAGTVEEVRADGESHWMTVSYPSLLAPYFIHRGSVAVDGVSLTLAGLGPDRFDIQIVPFTWAHTNLSERRARDRVNLECDIIGKYVVRTVELAGADANRRLH